MVAGVDKPAGRKAVMDGYGKMDVARARSLGKEFAADYVVVRQKDRSDALVDLPEVYSDGSYVVYGINHEQHTLE